MKKLIASAFTLLLASTFTFAQTPSADQVIDNYIKAIGGKDAIAKIQDYTTTMTGEVQGMSLEISLQRKVPNKMLQIASIAGMGEVGKTQCDGKSAKMSQQGQEIDIKDAELTAMLAQSKLFPETGYAAAGAKLALLGTEKIDGKDCYKIGVTLGEITWTDFYDAATGLKTRQVISRGPATVISTFGDYKEVDGVKFPFKLNQDTGQFVLDLTASKIETNKNLPDSLFEVK